MWLFLVGFTAICLVVVVAVLASQDRGHRRIAIPERYAGTWSGTVRYTSYSGTSKVRIKLPTGRKTGKSTYGKECTEKLIPVKADDSRLTLHELPTNEYDDCEESWISATTAKHHRLRLIYSDTEDGPASATATVRHQRR